VSFIHTTSFTLYNSKVITRLVTFIALSWCRVEVFAVLDLALTSRVV